MSSVNKVILIGRLGADPEFKTLDGGNKVANISVATSESFKDKDGNKKETTEWHKVSVWGTQGENVSKYLTKGSQVYVEGRLQTRSWDDKDGNKKYTTEVVASSVVFLDSKKSSENGGGTTSTNTTKAANTSQSTNTKQPVKPAVTVSDDDSEDLPF